MYTDRPGTFSFIALNLHENSQLVCGSMSADEHS
jgi:hypothetical protein